MTTSTPQAIAIFSIYPRKVKKPLALKAILKAIGRDGYEKVLAGTKAYAARVQEAGKDLQFVPYPASFYNAEVYNDDLDALFPKNGQTNGHHKRSVRDLKTILQAKEDKRAALRNKFRHEGPTGNHWSSEAKRLEAVALSKEINAINEEIASC